MWTYRNGAVIRARTTPRRKSPVKLITERPPEGWLSKAQLLQIDEFQHHPSTHPIAPTAGEDT